MATIPTPVRATERAMRPDIVRRSEYSRDVVKTDMIIPKTTNPVKPRRL
jgi:hypothetical protein